MQKLIRWIRRFFRRNSVKQFVADVKKNRYRPGLYKNFDWPLFILVMCISLFGVVSIFAATASATETEVTGLVNILTTHSTRYPTLQLIWMLLGVGILFAVTFLDYRLYGKYHQLLYIANIGILLLVLGMEAGRGGMRAFFTISTSSSTLGQRGFQPSEFGKFIMMICLAKLFSMRKAPIKNIQELLPTAIYVIMPMVLVFLQPDFGTALVYMVMYVVLLYISGTKRKLIYGLLAVVIAIAIPLWFYINTASDSFRLTRILMWLNPDQYPDQARQVINSQIAIG
ncbi:MAG: FtsW/RodA/SpoVE family cell cycle protein, partial [Clostridia bacterium]|nr:FtsW/RodA/SpoVE family cell cycle protein [Clostridia bacterium]